MGFESEKERKRHLARNRPEWAKWYSKPRWRTLRKRLLAINDECSRCGGKATILDHMRPHRGNEQLFYDVTNLQPMCKRCHDSKTARIDSGFAKGGRDKMIGRCDEDGMPIDENHPWNAKDRAGGKKNFQQ